MTQTNKPGPRAQRIALTPTPGVMLKRAFNATKRIRLRQVMDSDPAYLAMVRELPCLCCGVEDYCECAHVRMQSAAHGKRGGIGKKPADKWAVPLCSGCHRLDNDSQHAIGEIAFWDRVGINPLLVCQRLYSQRGDIPAMRAVILTAIAERESRSQSGK